MTEKKCDDCGLPISVCNARAMIKFAIDRHGSVNVGRMVGDLFVVADGVHDDAPATQKEPRMDRILQHALNGSFATKVRNRGSYEEMCVNDDQVDETAQFLRKLSLALVDKGIFTADEMIELLR